ncbi:MAG TPA: gliding motility-associated C-terminal domain-containing protein, partial [Cytophagales bacterium]|nr:gliding motility-associated C-terminal domain-containing protein [Cytophagales bacterium]
WNTGQLSSKIWPIRDQIYVLNVIDGNGCEVRDQIKVSTYPMDTLKVVVPSEDVYCGVSICVPIAMRAGYQSYSINDTLLMNPDVCWPRNKAHAYSVKVVDEFGCIQGHTFVYDCSVYLGPIPNIITPKEPDGLNDTFAVQGLLGEYWQLHVYNRYGVRVFESKHYNNDWDASGEGAGIYFYELTHKDKNITYKGWVEVR